MATVNVDHEMVWTLQHFANCVQNPKNVVKHEVPPVTVRIPTKKGPIGNWQKIKLATLSNEVTDMMTKLCKNNYIVDLVKVAGNTFVDDPKELATLSTVLFEAKFFDNWSKCEFMHDHYIEIMEKFHANVTELCAEKGLDVRQSSFNDMVLKT